MVLFRSFTIELILSDKITEKKFKSFRWKIVRGIAMLTDVPLFSSILMKHFTELLEDPKIHFEAILPIQPAIVQLYIHIKKILN